MHPSSGLIDCLHLQYVVIKMLINLPKTCLIYFYYNKIMINFAKASEICANKELAADSILQCFL